MSFAPISGYNPPDPDPAARMPTRTTRRLLLAADEDDAYAWRERHGCSVLATILWTGRFHSLAGRPAFDRMITTAAAYRKYTSVQMDPEGWWLLLDHPVVRACLTRVKGPDGLTPGQRLTADEIGTRLRETT